MESGAKIEVSYGCVGGYVRAIPCRMHVPGLSLNSLLMSIPDHFELFALLLHGHSNGAALFF